MGHLNASNFAVFLGEVAEHAVALSTPLYASFAKCF